MYLDGAVPSFPNADARYKEFTRVLRRAKDESIMSAKASIIRRFPLMSINGFFRSLNTTLTFDNCKNQ